MTDVTYSSTFDAAERQVLQVALGELLHGVHRDKHLSPTIRSLMGRIDNAITVVLVVLCGIIFPLLLFAIGQIAFPTQANGSLITDRQGHVIGSSLIGQQFTQPVYFHGRPSAVGYNGAGSDSSALGPTNPQLISGNGQQITLAPGATPPPGATPVPGKPNTYEVPGSYLGVRAYADQFRKENGLSPDAPLPADIVTASGSGLDPDISVEAANFQRVVSARKALLRKNAAITTDQVMDLISRWSRGSNSEPLAI